MYTLGCKKGNQEVAALCVPGSDSQGQVSPDIGTCTFGLSRKTAAEKLRCWKACEPLGSCPVFL